MSDKNIRKRRQDRAEFRRLQMLKEEKAKLEANEMEKRRVLEDQRKVEDAAKKEEKRIRREERRRIRRLQVQQKAEKRKKEAEERKRHHEVAVEERKLLLAQRQLESMRLISVLLERFKAKEEIKLAEQERIRREEDERRLKEESRQQEIEKESQFRKMLNKKEKELRRTLLKAKRKEERMIRKKLEKHEKKEPKKSRKLSEDIRLPEVDANEIVSNWLDNNFSLDIQSEIASTARAVSISKPSDVPLAKTKIHQSVNIEPDIVSRPPKLSSVVLVVSGKRKADAEEPLFEAPLNILYC